MTFDTRTMAPNSSSGLGEASLVVEFETVKTPLPSDILCGKDKICIKHEGSKSFRRIIESYTPRYQQATSRNEKMEITKEIYDKLQSRRFLKYNQETEIWETLHPLAKRDKIGHALRFANRKGSHTIRKQVRRSTSEITTLRQADLASFKNCSSLGALESLKGPLQEDSLLHSTGSLAFPSLPQRSAEVSAFLKEPQQIQSSLSSLALGGSMHPSDLSWMMQMPLMEMESDGKVYFVNGQKQQAIV